LAQRRLHRAHCRRAATANSTPASSQANNGRAQHLGLRSTPRTLRAGQIDIDSLLASTLELRTGDQLQGNDRHVTCCVRTFETGVFSSLVRAGSVTCAMFTKSAVARVQISFMPSQRQDRRSRALICEVQFRVLAALHVAMQPPPAKMIIRRLCTSANSRRCTYPWQGAARPHRCQHTV
jgi:hypothetical protein